MPLADPAAGRTKAGSIKDCGKLIWLVKPVYPKQAKQEHVQGTVKLRAVISKTGEIGDLQVLEGHPLLVPAALDAARQWRYEPCLFNSEPVEVITVIHIQFPPNP